MGKKTSRKNISPKETFKKITPQKRNELNQLIDSLLKLGFGQTNNANEQWKQYLEIRSMLDRIEMIERTVKIKNSESGRSPIAIGNFCTWAKENGSTFDGVKITEFPKYGLGLQAEKCFEKGEIFVTVPKRMIMSEESLDKCLESIVEKIPMFNTMPNIGLAFALSFEKNNSKSFWKPYIDLLPEKYTTVMNFTVNEMQELKGSNILSHALNQCKSIARQYALLYKCLQSLKHENFSDSLQWSSLEDFRERFTYDLYCWSVSTVMTRQNSIPRSLNLANESNSMMPALIPLWDFANHRKGEVTSSYNLELDHLESCTLSNFAVGDQIFMYYGDRPNSDLLLHNGFIDPENAKDSILIKLGLGNSDELLSERMQLLDLLGIPKNSELKLLPPPNFISSQLLAFVRIFNMNKVQLDHWIQSNRATDLLHIDCALETSLEAKTWLFLRTRISLLLKIFPTSLSDDEINLAKHKSGETNLGNIRGMLLEYRILEKRILTEALEYAEQKSKA